jgi:hypothetical protein
MWNVQENSDIRTTENRNIGHCADTSGSSNVNFQNVYHDK